MNKNILWGFALGMLFACNGGGSGKQEVQTFLDEYNQRFRELSTAASEAEWQMNTHIEEGDTLVRYRSDQAKNALAAFTGSTDIIDKCQAFLKDTKGLDELQIKQLKKILYLAANNPQTVPELVKERIKAESAQTEKLFGFSYALNGKPVTTNQLDSILSHSTLPPVRLQAWTASKEVGKTLKPGLENLQRLRNETVRNLGYDDYFSYQVSDYGMTRLEMMQLMQQLIRDVWPLYRELHTYARYELADKYRFTLEVRDQVQLTLPPDMLPAHWLPNRWGQDWSSLVEVKGVNLDSVLQSKGAEWITGSAEKFYQSLGMPALPGSFYEKSSLYPLQANSPFKKNNHASAWHIDLDQDVRSLMSIAPNAEWYETVHHELGHVYYYLAYSRKEVPMVLREGANRAYHEAVGSLMGLAAMQRPFLEQNKLINSGANNNQMELLLKEALNYIVFIPFSAGTMTHFEHDLYARNLSPDEYNKRWWAYAARFQGIVPPEGRNGLEYCDAATKTHINDDPAQYYDYALSYVLLFQLHDHIAKQILKQDPHATNYYGSKEVGQFLHKILEQGGTADWRAALKEATGSELSAKPMLEYFQPLMAYLQEKNRGRRYTLPVVLDPMDYSLPVPKTPELP